MKSSSSLKNTKSNYQYSNSVDRHSKVLVAAITNEIAISICAAKRIDTHRIEHSEHKKIVGTWCAMYNEFSTQPSAMDLAGQLIKDSDGMSGADTARLAGKVENGVAWGGAPNVQEINFAINNLSAESHIGSLGVVRFTDLHPTKNTPLGTLDNAKSLVGSLGLTPAYNAMDLSTELLKDGAPMPASYEFKRSLLISEALKCGLPKAVVDDHFVAMAEEVKYHPVVEWLSSDKWDGKKRVIPLIDAMNARDNSGARIAMRKWFVACIAALYEPSFSCKLVPVLQGDQSYMKTAFISRFANVVGGAFLEGAELNPDSKDSVLSCIRSWIVELGELERTSKHSQGSLKALLSKSIDTVRPPYGRTDIKKKRQTVFIASVNGSEFLLDETGSSRYAVIELAKAINMNEVNDILGWSYSGGRIQLLEEYKLRQFWLEVKCMYDEGYSWMLTTDELEFFTRTNDAHKMKSDYRYELEEEFLGEVDMDVKEMRWMKSSEVCAYFGYLKGKSKEIGRALTAMAKDRLIQMKEGTGRNPNKYLLPIPKEFSV